MAEVTTEGHMSTTTTIIDGKNGSVPSSSMKVGKKSLTEDLVTTFSSPAAWILVVALIVTWSAVAIVVFDLVDYKNLAATYSQHCDDPCLPPGRSVNKLSTEPLRIIHETLEETTDWLYGFLSFLSDIIWSDDDDSDEGEVDSSLTKEIHKEKPDKHEKRAPSKVIQKDKPEKHDKTEKKPSPKEEKKVKSTKVEAKAKKEVKDGKEEAKTEKAKQAETKTTEVGLIKAKTKVKEEKALQTITKSEKKDQYAFCRYVIDMFAQGDFYPGHKDFVPPRLLLEHSQGKKPGAIEDGKGKKKTDVKRTKTETKTKGNEVKKEKVHEKTAVPEVKKSDKKEAAVSKELKNPAKPPTAKSDTKRAAAPEPHKKEKNMETGEYSPLFTLLFNLPSLEAPKSKGGSFCLFLQLKGKNPSVNLTVKEKASCDKTE
ncbi:triadin [Calypte anna]|uniref:triadin n=1 Tax=Calypte anna TaxID=9244 RepID=UPI0011C34456|nr:triadin [Calypte anna]